MLVASGLFAVLSMEESGFSNASAYCRVFKRMTDTTPDAWRKSLQASTL